MTAAPETVPFDKWFEAHAESFTSYQYPHEMAQMLYDKLVHQAFDCGNYFSIDTSIDPTLLYTPADQTTPLTPGCNVFITDHCFAAKPKDIYSEWKNQTQLRERLAAFMEYGEAAQELTLEQILQKCDGKTLEIEFQELESIAPLEIATKFPHLEVLSLIGNNISNPAEILGLLAQLPDLKALWIGSNPVAEAEGIDKSILDLCPKLEILNAKFTKNWGEWALLYYAHNKNPALVANLKISGRGITELKPEAFKNFKNLSVLDITNNEVDVSKIIEIIPSLTSLYCDNKEQAPQSLQFINGADEKENVVSIPIPDRIWDHIQAVGEYWCLGDEIALSIHHSLEPNVAQMPVRSPLNGQSYFVFWPVAVINPFDEIKADLFPLIPLGAEVPAERPPLTPMKSLKSKFHSSVISKRPIKTYIDMDIFREHLHSDKFQLVDTPEEADLIWYTFKNFDDWKHIYESKILVDQIEGEECLTAKDYLYETCTQYMGQVPWLPETFILTEPEEIARFVQRNEELKKSGQSHVWILKAFQTARANLMICTDSASEVLRHASIGPRLVQRYLWNPLNIYGRKFDLRFIVLLKSVKPMELYAYKVFWPRLAPKEWALEDFDDYERHFTVMNYRAPGKVTPKTWVDFVQQFAVENPNITWEEVLNRCYIAMRDMFMCGCQKLVASPYSKAMYGIDLMITNDYQPVILECNFQPDCHRACNLCPTFVDDVFEVLYTDQPVTNDKVVFIPLD